MLPVMATPELQHKVRQHDNELEAIYEIVSGHGEDLIEIKAALAEIGSKVDEQGAKLDELLAVLRGGPGESPPRA
jgi:chromosome segregation ATPase